MANRDSKRPPPYNPNSSTLQYQQQRYQQPNQPPYQQQPQKQQPQPAAAGRHKARKVRENSEISLFTKYVLFFVNIISWIIGLLIVGIGIWAWYVRGQFDGVESLDSLVQSPLVDPSWWLVVLGTIIFLIATFGCIGALRENTILLHLYKYSLILVLLLEVAAGVAIYYYQDTIEKELANQIFAQAIPEYRNNPDFQDLVDNVQQELRCCGVYGYEDWNDNLYFNCSNSKVTRNHLNPEACGVPFSCCKKDLGTLSYFRGIVFLFNINGHYVLYIFANEIVNTQCGYGVRKETFDEVLKRQTIYTGGCVDAFSGWILQRFDLVFIAAIGGVIIIAEIIGICLASAHIIDVKRQKSKWQH